MPEITKIAFFKGKKVRNTIHTLPIETAQKKDWHSRSVETLG